MFNSHLAYLETIVVFAGSALVVEWLVVGDQLKKHARHLIIVGIILLVFAVAETPALWLGAWVYNVPRTLHIHLLGTELETYIFALLTGLAVAGATLVFADYQDGVMPEKHSKFHLRRPPRL